MSGIRIKWLHKIYRGYQPEAGGHRPLADVVCVARIQFVTSYCIILHDGTPETTSTS
jgi:hypothetical protein